MPLVFGICSRGSPTYRQPDSIAQVLFTRCSFPWSRSAFSPNRGFDDRERRSVHSASFSLPHPQLCTPPEPRLRRQGASFCLLRFVSTPPIPGHAIGRLPVSSLRSSFPGFVCASVSCCVGYKYAKPVGSSLFYPPPSCRAIAVRPRCLPRCCRI